MLLNGASSAGKTSLARAMQEQLDGWWLVFGVDSLINAVPRRTYGTADGHSMSADGVVSIGPGWRLAHDRWRMAMRSLVEAGADLIIDEVFLEGERDQDRWRTTLQGAHVSWVKVRCDVEVAVAREAARGDRRFNIARLQAGIVHDGVEYDVVADTTSSAPDEVAKRLIADLGRFTPPKSGAR